MVGVPRTFVSGGDGCAKAIVDLLVEVNSTVRKLAECSLSLKLCSKGVASANWCLHLSSLLSIPLCISIFCHLRRDASSQNPLVADDNILDCFVG